MNTAPAGLNWMCNACGVPVQNTALHDGWYCSLITGHNLLESVARVLTIADDAERNGY